MRGNALEGPIWQCSISFGLVLFFWMKTPLLLLFAKSTSSSAIDQGKRPQPPCT